MRFKIKIIEISDDLKSNHDFDFKIKIMPISGNNTGGPGNNSGVFKSCNAIIKEPCET